MPLINFPGIQWKFPKMTGSTVFGPEQCGAYITFLSLLSHENMKESKLKISQRCKNCNELCQTISIILAMIS